MVKTTLFVVITVLLIGVSFSQALEAPISWRWLKGTSVVNQFSVCGNAGQYSSSYSSGSRYRISMTDSSLGAGHTAYVYGGAGYHATGGSTSTKLGDMWGYRLTEWSGIGEWAWVGGKSDAALCSGVYSGTMYPGARETAGLWAVPGSPTRVFLFGGAGYASGLGNLNDVWSFDLSARTRNFLKGSSVHSQRGIAGVMIQPTLKALEEHLECIQVITDLGLVTVLPVWTPLIDQVHQSSTYLAATKLRLLLICGHTTRPRMNGWSFCGIIDESGAIQNHGWYPSNWLRPMHSPVFEAGSAAAAADTALDSDDEPPLK